MKHNDWNEEYDLDFMEPQEDDPHTAQRFFGWMLLALCVGFALVLSRAGSLEDSNGSVLVVLVPLAIWMIRTKRILF